jgi:hypothetical protein
MAMVTDKLFHFQVENSRRLAELAIPLSANAGDGGSGGGGGGGGGSGGGGGDGGGAKQLVFGEGVSMDDLVRFLSADDDFQAELTRAGVSATKGRPAPQGGKKKKAC